MYEKLKYDCLCYIYVYMSYVFIVYFRGWFTFYSVFLVYFFIVWKLVCTLSREQISSVWIEQNR